MLAKDLLNINFTPLKPSDSITTVMAKMDAWQSPVLPVVEPKTKKNIGQIELSAISSLSDEALIVSDIELSSSHFALKNQHIFEVARQMLIHETRIIPVVDENESFIGIIEKKDVQDALSTMLNVANNGSVLLVELGDADFTISKLVQIVETEGAKILGLTVEKSNNDAPGVIISMKLNLQDISAVTASLRRHGFSISTESSNDHLQVDLTSRADELMRYLNV